MRDEQIMAQALVDWCVDNKLPPQSLKKMVRHHLGNGQDDPPYLRATNICHMAAGCWVGLHPKNPKEALAHLRTVYDFDFTQVFRTVFEGESVGYSGYNSLTPTTMLLRCPDPVVRELARQFLRWDYTIQALCSTPNGRVIMPCGRIYDSTGKGIYEDATDFRQRAIQGIHNDWWPPKGVGPNYWNTTKSVPAQPWKKIAGLPSMVFSIEERAALRAWVTERTISDTLRELMRPIRVYQTIHVAPIAGGHLAWMEDLHSYAAGKNTAQPLVWAQGDEIKKAVIQKPPTGCIWNGTNFTVNGVPVQGFPSPGSIQITIGPNGPVN